MTRAAKTANNGIPPADAGTTTDLVPLKDFLAAWAGDDASRRAVAETVERFTEVGRDVAALVARGPLAGAMGSVRGENTDGDAQKELDVLSNDMFLAGLEGSPVNFAISEELEDPLQLDPTGPLSVAFDPLDGSSNIDTNVSVGTIFSVFPTAAGANPDDAASVLQPGTCQLAAGYIIYGPQTALVLTVGDGAQIFTLDPDGGRFLLTAAHVAVPETTKEFAINVSNHRHWDEPVRAYVDDCLDGKNGPRGRSFNMRWVASLVAECHRILSRGGIFLYPRDRRPSYGEGRLRLLYEAYPIAWLIEQAGGAATTGTERVLEVEPVTPHQRVPLIFGSRTEVAEVERYHKGIRPAGERHPLFAAGGLFHP